MFPASATLQRTKSSSDFLSTANGLKIDAWGQRPVTLNFGKNKVYQQDLYLAYVTRPILDSNFSANNIAIDLRGRRLIDLNNFSNLHTSLKMQSITLSSWPCTLLHPLIGCYLISRRFWSPDFNPLSINMEWNTRSLPMIILCFHDSVDCLPISLQLLKESFPKWRKQASFVAPTLRGLNLYTLFLNRLVVGNHSATTDCLTTCLQMTDTEIPSPSYTRF